MILRAVFKISLHSFLDCVPFESNQMHDHGELLHGELFFPLLMRFCQRREMIQVISVICCRQWCSVGCVCSHDTYEMMIMLMLCYSVSGEFKKCSLIVCNITSPYSGYKPRTTLPSDNTMSVFLLMSVSDLPWPFLTFCFLLVGIFSNFCCPSYGCWWIQPCKFQNKHLQMHVHSYHPSYITSKGYPGCFSSFLSCFHKDCIFSWTFMWPCLRRFMCVVWVFKSFWLFIF